MIITFVSAFLNHHQLLLSEELKKHCDEFYYISMTKMSPERKALGYEDLESKCDYVIKGYDNSVKKSVIDDIILRSDAVIFGECYDRHIEMRMRENKLSFIYSERFFKKGTWRRFIPKTAKKIKRRVIQHKDKKLYVLCASAFLSYDLKFFGFDTDKCFKWGYFPKVSDKEICPERHNSVPKILWAGRMIDWKHPEYAIEAAAYLKNKGIEFSLDMIGSGECETHLKERAQALGVEDRVSFLGSMNPGKVMEYMEKADIFLMTSDCKEGWGAVVNEAMSTGCAVLGSSEAGCVPFLIEENKNGLIYKTGNKKDFNKKLESLVTDKELRRKLSLSAFDTIKNEYNQIVAVDRLMEFIENGCQMQADYKNGPMSKACVTKNKWYKS